VSYIDAVTTNTPKHSTSFDSDNTVRNLGNSYLIMLPGPGENKGFGSKKIRIIRVPWRADMDMDMDMDK